METKVIKKISKKGEASYEYYVDGVKVRKSNRLYIASTANGEMFWGKAHLIGNGMYNHFMESIAKNSAITFDEIKASCEKKVQKYSKVKAEYHTEAHRKEIYDYWYSIRVRHVTPAEYEKEVDEMWERDKQNADKWLADAIAANTKEAIEKEVERRHKWAEDRKKALQIVRYDISNL